MRKPKGISTIYLIIFLVVLIGFASLGVDLGRVQLAKTELQQATDAAARYAALGLSNGTATSRAMTAAAENKVDGSPVIITTSDVQTGNWNASATPHFSTSRTPVNAVWVTAGRSTGRRNAIPLVFGSIIGASSCDVNASTIAVIKDIPSGFIGLQDFTVKNNVLSASYDSAVGTDPTSSTYKDSGMLGSNVSITAKNNEVVGLVVLGNSATTNLSLPQPPVVLPGQIPIPTVDFSAAPNTNPAGTPKNLVVSGNLELPGGSYYFKSITLKNNSSLTFTGSATLYVDGDVLFEQSGKIDAHNGIPANLAIKQRGTGTIFGGDKKNNVDVTAAIDAPQTDFIAFNSTALKGRATFRTITVKNNAEFYLDEALGAAIPGTGKTVMIVK